MSWMMPALSPKTLSRRSLRAINFALHGTPGKHEETLRALYSGLDQPDGRLGEIIKKREWNLCDLEEVFEYFRDKVTARCNDPQVKLLQRNLEESFENAHRHQQSPERISSSLRNPEEHSNSHHSSWIECLLSRLYSPPCEGNRHEPIPGNYVERATTPAEILESAAKRADGSPKTFIRNELDGLGFRICGQWATSVEAFLNRLTRIAPELASDTRVLLKKAEVDLARRAEQYVAGICALQAELLCLHSRISGAKVSDTDPDLIEEVSGRLRQMRSNLESLEELPYVPSQKRFLDASAAERVDMLNQIDYLDAECRKKRDIVLLWSRHQSRYQSAEAQAHILIGKIGFAIQDARPIISVDSKVEELRRLMALVKEEFLSFRKECQKKCVDSDFEVEANLRTLECLGQCFTRVATEHREMTRILSLVDEIESAYRNLLLEPRNTFEDLRRQVDTVQRMVRSTEDLEEHDLSSSLRSRLAAVRGTCELELERMKKALTECCSLQEEKPLCTACPETPATAGMCTADQNKATNTPVGGPLSPPLVTCSGSPFTSGTTPRQRMPSAFKRDPGICDINHASDLCADPFGPSNHCRPSPKNIEAPSTEAVPSSGPLCSQLCLNPVTTEVSRTTTSHATGELAWVAESGQLGIERPGSDLSVGKPGSQDILSDDMSDSVRGREDRLLHSAPASLVSEQGQPPTRQYPRRHVATSTQTPPSLSISHRSQELPGKVDVRDGARSSGVIPVSHLRDQLEAFQVIFQRFRDRNLEDAWIALNHKALRANAKQLVGNSIQGQGCRIVHTTSDSCDRSQVPFRSKSAPVRSLSGHPRTGFVVGITGTRPQQHAGAGPEHQELHQTPPATVCSARTRERREASLGTADEPYLYTHSRLSQVSTLSLVPGPFSPGEVKSLASTQQLHQEIQLLRARTFCAHKSLESLRSWVCVDFRQALSSLCLRCCISRGRGASDDAYARASLDDLVNTFGVSHRFLLIAMTARAFVNQPSPRASLQWRKQRAKDLIERIQGFRQLPFLHKSLLFEIVHRLKLIHDDGQPMAHETPEFEAGKRMRLLKRFGITNIRVRPAGDVALGRSQHSFQSRLFELPVASIKQDAKVRCGPSAQEGVAHELDTANFNPTVVKCHVELMNSYSRLDGSLSSSQVAKCYAAGRKPSELDVKRIQDLESFFDQALKKQCLKSIESLNYDLQSTETGVGQKLGLYGRLLHIITCCDSLSVTPDESLQAQLDNALGELQSTWNSIFR